MRGVKKLLIGESEEKEIQQIVKMYEAGKTVDEISWELYKVLSKEKEKDIAKEREESYYKRYGDSASEAERNFARRVSKHRFIKSIINSIDY